MTPDDPVRLIHGDALAVLPTLPDASVDCILTDPPYGTDAPADGYGRRGKWQGAQHIEGDADLTTFAAALPRLLTVLKPGRWFVTFCSPKRRDDAGDVLRSLGLRVRGEVVWDKESPGLGGGIRYQHETVLLCACGTRIPAGGCELASVVREWIPKGQHGHRAQHHPHEKPRGLMRLLCRYACPEGGLILDPFMGSGTTLAACLDTGRRGIGIEINPAYFAVAEARIRDARTGGPMFDFAARKEEP